MMPRKASVRSRRRQKPGCVIDVVGELVARVAQRRRILVVLASDSGVVVVMKFEIGPDATPGTWRPTGAPLVFAQPRRAESSARRFDVREVFDAALGPVDPASGDCLPSQDS